MAVAEVAATVGGHRSVRLRRRRRLLMGAAFVLLVTAVIAVLAPWFGADSRDQRAGGDFRW